MLFAQAAHLLTSESGIGKHTALLEDETEVCVGQPLADTLNQERTHTFDALSHSGKFAFPVRAKLGRGQHSGDNLRAVRGWIGIVSAHDLFELRAHSRSLLAGRRDNAQCADALPIERERFGKGARDQDRHCRFRKKAEPQTHPR